MAEGCSEIGPEDRQPWRVWAGKKLEVSRGLAREMGSQWAPQCVATKLPRGIGGQDGEREFSRFLPQRNLLGSMAYVSAGLPMQGHTLSGLLGVFLSMKTLLFGVEGNLITWCLLEGEIKAHFHQRRSKVGSCFLSHFLDFIWQRRYTGPHRNLPEMPSF